MRARRERKTLKALENLLEELKHKYIIVEGKKDVASLQKLGLKAFPYSKKTLEKAHGEVAILTDLDSAGEELGKRISEELRENNSVSKVDLFSRKMLSYLLNLKHFEEAYKKYLKFVEEVER